MSTVNYPLVGDRSMSIRYTLGGLGIPVARGDEKDVDRVRDISISLDDAQFLRSTATAVGVSERFRDVLRTFPTPEGELPAGFRVEPVLRTDGLLEVDLVRDISRDRNNMKRPTGVVFSADSANPYEVAPVAPLLGNLTCNPGIVYDLFINNPEANIGHKFNTLEEVMTELGNILGPGCDVSVEIEDPFESDFDKILASIAPFEEILSPYRLVVKVPHTGPINQTNASQLFNGDKRLNVSYRKAGPKDSFRGHELALKLRERGYRVNFTLMFEPYQTALALQAKPAFINSFIRHRAGQTTQMAALLDAFDSTGDLKNLEELRTAMLANDYLSSAEKDVDLMTVRTLAREVVSYRRPANGEGDDGLDAVRHNLRLLKQDNLADTRLIVCSMAGPLNYPDLDRVLVDPEFFDVIDRMVITAEPGYLAQFATTNQVISYQRRFLNAVIPK